MVEPSQAALIELIRHLVANRHELLAARAPALEASREFTWQHYRRRVGNLFRERLA